MKRWAWKVGQQLRAIYAWEWIILVGGLTAGVVLGVVRPQIVAAAQMGDRWFYECFAPTTGERVRQVELRTEPKMSDHLVAGVTLKTGDRLWASMVGCQVRRERSGR